MEGKLIRLVLVTAAMFLEISGSGYKDCKKEPRCRISFTHKMKAADCFRKEMKEFPKCLPTDIEVLELTYNRLRLVTKEDLSRFSYLKFLYLSDNLISDLDDETFSDLHGLTTLDLSLNALRKIPNSVFQLPSLKTLYLSQNRNINIIDALDGAKPIISPLTQLDISYTTGWDDATEFPDFGPMPFLASLNISGNQYYSARPRHILGMCKLQVFITDNVTVDFDDPCDCWKVNQWLSDKRVKFIPFQCTVTKVTCADQLISDEDMLVYDECVAVNEELERQNRMYKLSVGLIMFFVILLLCIALYFWIGRKHCRNLCNKKSKEINAVPVNTGLLDNTTKGVPNEYVL